jgi:hypothetical protein
LFTGHNKGLVKIFDIKRPDQTPITIELKIGKNRIHSPVSSLDIHRNLLAIGSFDKRIYLIDSN